MFGYITYTLNKKTALCGLYEALQGGSTIKKGWWFDVTSEVLVSILSISGSFLATFAGIMVNSKLVNYRIEQLEKKVEKHSQVIDRVYKLEQSDAVENEEIKVINHRIADLEQYHK